MYRKNHRCTASCVCLALVHGIFIAAIGAGLLYAYSDKAKGAVGKMKNGAADCIDACRDAYENIKDDICE